MKAAFILIVEFLALITQTLICVAVSMFCLVFIYDIVKRPGTGKRGFGASTEKTFQSR